MLIYKVGGCVRDKLMGIEPRDIDWLVVGATPEEMLAQGYARVGADFPVFLHPGTHDEYALARKERKTSSGHKGFQTVFDTGVTLEEDLSRRDLTINAMAEDPSTGAIHDPYGGQADLEARVLRHVSEAFSEDPLRVMRLARFQARTGFTVAEPTLELCRAICASGALLELSRERICTELRKLFDSPSAAEGMATLASCGALASLDPQWPARLGASQLDGLRMCQAQKLPEWASARLACVQGMDADSSKRFMESLRFPADAIRWASRLGCFCAWALSRDSNVELAAIAAERCGAVRMGEQDLAVFGSAAALELTAAGLSSRDLALALAALAAAPAIATAVLTDALALPKSELPAAVQRAKAEAFGAAWPLAQAQSRPTAPRP